MARRAQVASATKAPLLAVTRRWIPDGATAGRARLAIAVNFSSLALAIGLYALVQPAADWTNATLLIALAALAVLAYLAEANLKLPPAGFFDAGVVLALLALGLAGPWRWSRGHLGRRRTPQRYAALRATCLRPPGYGRDGWRLFSTF